MNDELTHLRNRIRTMEDNIIRCKDYAMIEQMRSKVMKMRTELQKLEWNKKKD